LRCGWAAACCGDGPNATTDLDHGWEGLQLEVNLRVRGRAGAPHRDESGKRAFRMDIRALAQRDRAERVFDSQPIKRHHHADMEADKNPSVPSDDSGSD
jgi:hypothetical protein